MKKRYCNRGGNQVRFSRVIDTGLSKLYEMRKFNYTRSDKIRNRLKSGRLRFVLMKSRQIKERIYGGGYIFISAFQFIIVSLS